VAIQQLDSWTYLRVLSAESSIIRFVSERKEKYCITRIGGFFKLYVESHNSEQEFVKLIKHYLLDPGNKEKRASTIDLEQSAIKAYFEKNDSPIHFQFNSKATHKVTDEDDDQPSLTLDDLLKMLTTGRPTVTQKAMILCKFHRGLDTSTFVDRFNFQSWPQLVDWFGTEEYRKWDLDKCPVPIKLTRIKTGFIHTGFLERDAVSAIGESLYNVADSFINNVMEPPQKSKTYLDLHVPDGTVYVGDYTKIWGNLNWIDGNIAKGVPNAPIVIDFPTKNSNGGYLKNIQVTTNSQGYFEFTGKALPKCILYASTWDNNDISKCLKTGYTLSKWGQGKTSAWTFTASYSGDGYRYEPSKIQSNTFYVQVNS